MKSGGILDSEISASTINSFQSGPHRGRLEHQGEWFRGNSDPNPWLQVDFLTRTIVSGVETQGSTRHNYWVRDYTISYSNDGVTFYTYREGEIIKVIPSFLYLLELYIYY